MCVCAHWGDTKMHNCGKGKNDHRGRGMEKHTQEGGRPHTIFGTHTQTETQAVRGSKTRIVKQIYDGIV